MNLRLANRSGRKYDRMRKCVRIHYWVSMNGYKEVLIALKYSWDNNVHVNIHKIHILVYINNIHIILVYMNIIYIYCYV